MQFDHFAVHEVCLSMGFVVVKETDPNWYNTQVLWQKNLVIKSLLLQNNNCTMYF